MQLGGSLGHTLYRIVFRRGSPQRLTQTPALTALALIAAPLSTVLAQWFFVGNDSLRIGVLLFLGICAMAIISALLSAKVVRARLRLSILTVLLIIACGQLLLLAFTPLAGWIGTTGVAVTTAIVVLLTLLGASNVLQFALRGKRPRALFLTAAFAIVFALIYYLLCDVLEVVFA